MRFMTIGGLTGAPALSLWKLKGALTEVPALSIKGLKLGAVALALLGQTATPAHATLFNEPFELESFYSYGGSKDGTFSLTYVGRGGGRCDWTDYRFRINVNRSYPGSDWKYFSNNTRYQWVPSRRPMYGHDLGTPNAHLCIGWKEFSSWYFPSSYWTASGVQQNIYTWRR